MAIGAVGLVAVGGAVVAVVRSAEDDPSFQVADVAATEQTDATATVPTATVPTAAPTTGEVISTTTPGATTASPSTAPATTAPATTLPATTLPAGAVPELAGAPTGVTGTEAEPVPFGQIADIGGGWRLQVLGFVPDATDAIVAAGSWPPDEGVRFSLVRIALGYFGLDEPGRGGADAIEMLGLGGRALETSCVELTDPITYWTYFAGGVDAGDMCFDSTPEDLAVAVLRVGDPADQDPPEPVTYLSLDPATATGDIVPLEGLPGIHTEASAAGARQSPTPLGTTVDLGDWSITVTAPAADLTDAVVAASTLNEPPPDGYRYIGLPVTYAYDEGADGTSDRPVSVHLGGVGRLNVPFGRDCGDVPGEVEFATHVPPGGTISGTFCMEVPIDELSDPTWLLTATSNGSPTSFLAVR